MGTLNLTKGQSLNLTKAKVGLGKVTVGLGWSEAPQPKQGFLAGLLGGGTKKDEIDCDAIALLLDASGKISAADDVIYYNRLKHKSGSIVHMGDNLVGGAGDAEQISIDLRSLPQNFERIVIAVSIYRATELNQHFGMVKNAFIRLVDADTSKELCIYNLTENYSNTTAMIFGELEKNDGEWSFNAVGEGLRTWSVVDICARYGLSKSVWK